MNEPLIVESLSKNFGSFHALNNVTFSINKGDVFGFLGPNGAGKTTTLRILLNLARPNSGTAKILGQDIHKSKQYLKKVGFLPDVPCFYNWMNPEEFLKFSSEFFDLNKIESKKRINELLEITNLQGVKKKIGGFSRGMKQRLGLAQALINNPEIIFMDEPTSALDPIGRKEVLETIEKIKDRTTVFFSTHILSDVERVCNKVAILNKGCLISYKDIKDLKQEFGTNIINLKLNIINNDILESLKKEEWVLDIHSEKNEIKLSVNDLDSSYYRIPFILNKHSIGLRSMENMEPSLEDIFVRLVNENVS